MLSVMLVDDEPLLRMAVKSVLELQSDEFRVVAEASNGHEAVERLSKIRPDIIIVDIKMPGMGGTELIQYIKQAGINAKCIVLSSFDNFDYVKEAMKNGAEDYILKTEINQEKLMSIMDKLKSDILAEDNEKSKRENMAREVLKNMEWLRNEYLRKVFYGEEEISNDLDKINEVNTYYGLNLQKGKYAVAVLEVDNAEEVLEHYSEANERKMIGDAIRNVIIKALKDSGVLFCDGFIRYVTIIYMESISELNFLNTVHDMCSKIQTMVARYTGISLSAGISSIATSTLQVSGMFLEGREAATYRFYKGYASISTYDRNYFSGLSRKNVDILNGGRHESILEHIERKDWDKALEDMDKYIHTIEERRLNEKDSKKLVTDLIILVSAHTAEFFKLRNIDDLSNQNIFEIINKMDLLSEVKIFASRYVQQCRKAVGSLNSSQYNSLVLETIEYVDKHFDEEISLADIALRINTNSSYLSRIFLRDTGEKFVDYLSQIRINKAKHFLRCSDVKVNEAGILVGYWNPRYFNRVFKKYVGISPSSYKKLYNSRKQTANEN